MSNLEEGVFAGEAFFEEGDDHQWWRIKLSGTEVAHKNRNKFGFVLEEKGL